MSTGPARAPSWSSLWLPLEARGPAWIATGLVLGYYLLTMSRDLSFYDSPELALVAARGGLGHPLGQPLHTLLGWIFARLPGVSTLVGLNLLSALPSALAVVPLMSIGEALVGPPGGESPRWLRRDVVLPVGLGLLAVQPTLWENATRVEVYSLAMFFALWAAARLGPLLASPEPRQPWGWLGAGIALGLSASANAIMALGTALALAPALVVLVARRRLALGDLLRGVAGGLIGLLPYLYLPLVASRGDVFVWGAPTGGTLLRRYLSNADFVHNQGITFGQLGANLWQWLGWAAGSFLLPVVLVGVVACWLLGRRAGLGRGFVAISFGLALLMLIQNVIFWPSIPDYLGYLSISVAVAGAAVAAAVVRLVALGGRLRWLAPVLGIAVLLNLALSRPAVHERTRHRDRLARVMAEGALRTAPAKAVVIVESDHWVFPLLYLQEVERQRPDVVVLPTGLSGASWYWSYLHRRHPGLKRFGLAGPGGRAGRVARFLAANPDRPVLFERYGQAMALRRAPGCGGPWLTGDRLACRGAFGALPDRLGPALDAVGRTVGPGSPPAAAVLARVTLERGEVLWRLGRPAEALRALRAGVPIGRRPRLGPVDVRRAGRLRLPPLRWKGRVLIGHWSQNLYLAGRLLWAAGLEAEARAHVRVAAAARVVEPPTR